LRSGIRSKHYWGTLLLVVGMLVCLTATAGAHILVREGSRGADVRQVQTLLSEQGYLTGAVDGVCGPQTVQAIKAFQQAKGLEVDGICGDGTYYVLSGGDSYEPEPGASGAVMYFSASAYSAEDPGLSPYTASGTLVHKGVAAVDPAVIPLGTHLYIPGYGPAVAEDIGYHIRGYRIDLAFDTHAEALAFGRQDVEVYIQ